MRPTRAPDPITATPAPVQGILLGDNLRAWCKKVTPSLAEITEVFFKLALALHALHRKGICHRNLGPHGILITDEDDPILIDPGLPGAKGAAPLAAEKDPPEMAGIPSPEACACFMSSDSTHEARFEHLPTADLHAVGCLLYEALTGQPPFPMHLSFPELIEHIRFQVPPAPSRLDPRVPRPLEAIALRLLEKEPGRRFQTALELALALQQALMPANDFWEEPLDPAGRRPGADPASLLEVPAFREIPASEPEP